MDAVITTESKANNLSLDNVEVPASFAAKFNEIKQAQGPAETPKRGRPRKAKDELDTSVKDEADAIPNEPVAGAAIATDEEIAQPEEVRQTVPAEADEYIPDELVIAGRRAGLTDATIQTLHTESPDTLKKLAGQVEYPAQAPPPARQAQPPKINEELLKPIEIKLDKDEHGEQLVNTVDALVKRINDQNAVMRQLTEQNASFEQIRRESARVAQQTSFDTTLDSMSKELPAVGSSAKLTTEQFAARETIWNHAVRLNGGNPPTSEAFGDAIAWYRGKFGTKVIEQNLLTKLKAQKGRLLARPTHRVAQDEVDTSGLSAEDAEKKRALHNIERVRRSYEP